MLASRPSWAKASAASLVPCTASPVWRLRVNSAFSKVDAAIPDCSNAKRSDWNCSAESATLRADFTIPSSVATASRSRGLTAASAGVTERITNGIPTRACAIGTSHHERRKSSGGRSSTSSIPKPRITAEVPSGTRKAPSRAAAPRRRWPLTARATSRPPTVAMPAAVAANSSEWRMAARGDTNRACRRSPCCPSRR